MRSLSRIASLGLALALGVVAACGGSSSSSSSSSGQLPSGITATSFDSSFSAMGQFKSLAAAGTGMVGVLLPDTASSARYVDFDAPYLTKAFEAAGYSSSQFKVTNAQGSDSTQQQQAESDITDGATVLLV